MCLWDGSYINLRDAGMGLLCAWWAINRVKQLQERRDCPSHGQCAAKEEKKKEKPKPGHTQPHLLAFLRPSFFP